MANVNSIPIRALAEAVRGVDWPNTGQNVTI